MEKYREGEGSLEEKEADKSSIIFYSQTLTTLDPESIFETKFPRNAEPAFYIC